MKSKRDSSLSCGRAAVRVSTEAGYTLLELLLVVAIMGVLLAIAVPGLTQPAKAANEVAAISYMRSWSSAQELYMARYGHYASSSAELAAEGLVPGDNVSTGYSFRLDNPPGSTDRWWGSAMPADPNVTGDRYFFIANDGVLRYSLDGPADATSPPISSTPLVPVVPDDVP